MSETQEQVDGVAQLRGALARAQKMTLAAVGLAIVALAIAVTATVLHFRTPKTVRAESFELLDAKGTIRGAWTADDYRTRLELISPGKVTRQKLVASKSRSAVSLFAPGQRSPWVTLDAVKSGSVVALKAQDPSKQLTGSIKLLIFNRGGGPSLEMSHRKRSLFQTAQLGGGGVRTGLLFTSKGKLHATANLYLGRHGGRLFLTGTTAAKPGSPPLPRTADLAPQGLLLWQKKLGIRTFTLKRTTPTPKPAAAPAK